MLVHSVLCFGTSNSPGLLNHEIPFYQGIDESAMLFAAKLPRVIAVIKLGGTVLSAIDEFFIATD